MAEVQRYSKIKKEVITETWCELFQGCIIIFNKKKCIVENVRQGGNHHYHYELGTDNVIDTTRSHCGYLKEIETGKVFNANWSTITKDKIISIPKLGRRF